MPPDKLKPKPPGTLVGESEADPAVGLEANTTAGGGAKLPREKPPPPAIPAAGEAEKASGGVTPNRDDGAKRDAGGGALLPPPGAAENAGLVPNWKPPGNADEPPVALAGPAEPNSEPTVGAAAEEPKCLPLLPAAGAVLVAGAATDVPPGFGASHEAHVVTPGPFMTRQDSHFHSPGFLNLDMSNPLAMGIEAGEASLAVPAAPPPTLPPPLPLLPPVAPGCGPPKVKPPLPVGSAEIVAFTALAPPALAVPKVKGGADVEAMLTPGVTAGCPPNVKVGAAADAGPTVPPNALLLPVGIALAPGFTVSHAGHVVTPGPFLTRHESHFHSPGLLNLDMSNPFVTGLELAALALVGAEVLPTAELAAPLPPPAADCAPNVNGEDFAGSAALPLGAEPKVNNAPDEAPPDRRPPDVLPPPLPPPTPPALTVSQERHVSVPGGFMTRQDSHFQYPGFLNLDMSNPFVMGARGAGTPLDVPGSPPPPPAPPPLSVPATSKRGATAGSETLSTAPALPGAMRAPFPRAVLRGRPAACR